MTLKRSPTHSTPDPAKPSTGKRRSKPSTNTYSYSNKPVLHPPVVSGQYTSVHFGETLMLEGLIPSIGSVGDAYDNALAETIIGLYKTECTRADSPFRSGPLHALADLEQATTAWVPLVQHRRVDAPPWPQTPNCIRGRVLRSTTCRPSGRAHVTKCASNPGRFKKTWRSICPIWAGHAHRGRRSWPSVVSGYGLVDRESDWNWDRKCLRQGGELPDNRSFRFPVERVSESLPFGLARNQGFT
jgi:hypothetical protein